ncbi:transport permease protein [Thiosulfatimonas sediminis]|uniref:Transport permease protein n=1 Tax=Thiosulfatimonas sediminis TaxID=2675054 RepID=A0A6F8PSS6_9GAMM|nr:ABC transporter permease [Thiosulfatimonas sediminis]BBP45084.1 transport permease protein [Thiosulfatimonas sediminis]
MFKTLLHYRYFILSSIQNELKSRFVRSKIGFLWLIIHPLAMVLVYALILSALIQIKLPETAIPNAYPIYLTAGILAWFIFSESLSRSLNLFIDNANLLKKIAFPKMVLPIIMMGNVLLNSLLLLVAILVVFAFLGHFPGWQILWLPMLFGLTLLLGTSIGIILGVLNVFIRDIGQIVPIVLNFMFWLTPIVYTITIIPEAYQKWFDLNPMTHLVAAFQDVLLYNREIQFSELFGLFLVSIGLLGLGFFLFKRANAEMLDQL